MPVPSPDDRGHRDALARAQIRAVEAGGGHQHHAADSGRGRCAAGFGDALDRERGRFGLAGAAFEFRRRRDLGIEQIEIGKIARQQCRIGEADIFVVGRDARHRDRALGEPRDAVAADVVGRDHRLALAHQHAQSDIVAFRALGFLDASVAHLDALRNAAHRHRVGGVRAGAPRRLDQPLRQRSSGRIDRTGRKSRHRMKAAKRLMVKRSRTKSRGLKEGLARARMQISEHIRCARFTGISSIFTAPKAKDFRSSPQGLVNHVSQGLVNHADECRAGDARLTSLFKRIRNALWHALAHRPGT